MNQNKFINQNIDPYSKITKDDYIKDYMDLSDFVSMICTG